MDLTCLPSLPRKVALPTPAAVLLTGRCNCVCAVHAGSCALCAGVQEILTETERVVGSNKGISEKPIRLKIYSPNVL